MRAPARLAMLAAMTAGFTPAPLWAADEAPAPVAGQPIAPLPMAAGTLVSEMELDGNRGGQTLVAGSQALTSVLLGNKVNGDYSAGAITLSGDALSNFNGIGNFAINTGAQVSLQTGVNLTIHVHQ